MDGQRDVSSVWSDVPPFGPPGSFVPLATDPERSGPVRSSWSSVDLVTVALLVVGAVPATAGLILVGAVGALVADVVVAASPWLGFVAAVAVWVSTGPLLLTDPAARVMAWLYRCRPPTQSEAEMLMPAWQQVAKAAEIDPSSYRLYVKSSDQLNAATGIGHLLVVTSEALTTLSPRQLAAVLAHELGHQLRGHAWATGLTTWYALPVQLLSRGVVRVLALTALRLDSGAAVAGMVVAAVAVVAVGVLVIGHLMLGLTVLLLIPLLANPSLRRWREFRADRVAWSLGFGDDLAQALILAHQLDAADQDQVEARVRRLIGYGGGPS
jgi:Zn-dependent protease with chaperone function